MSIVPSGCGNYVATIKDNLVIEINAARSSTIISFDVPQLAKRYLSISRNFKLSVTQLKWESSKDAECTKFGIILESQTYTMLMVLLLNQPHEPIIIHQPVREGIASFDWINPVKSNEDGEEEESGAYSNCKQVVIFSKHRLVARVYSLECTHILFELPKPVYVQTLIKPNSNIWLVITTQTDQNLPFIYHFYNHGSVSTMLTKFQLQTLPGSDISWSKSGKWLLNFDFSNQLYGYQLQVYTSLGIFKPRLTTKLKGDPFVDLDMTHADENRLLDYKAEWIRITERDGEAGGEEEEEECILIAGTRPPTSSAISMSVFSMKNLKLCNMKIPLDQPLVVWTVRGLLSKSGLGKNRSLFVRSLLPLSSVKLGNTLQSVETGDSNIFVLIYTSSLIVCRLINSKSTSVLAIIETSLRLRAIEFIENDSMIVFATEQEVCTYNYELQSANVIYTPINGLVNLVEYIGNNQLIAIGTDGEWSKVSVAPTPANVQAPTITSSHPRDDLTEDNTMKALRRSEWGMKFKRNRFSLIADSSRDDITDTFNLHSGAKRIRTKE